MFGQALQLIELIERQHGRFFDQHVLACFQSQPGCLKVTIIGSGNADKIDVGLAATVRRIRLVETPELADPPGRRLPIRLGTSPGACGDRRELNVNKSTAAIIKSARAARSRRTDDRSRQKSFPCQSCRRAGVDNPAVAAGYSLGSWSRRYRNRQPLASMAGGTAAARTAQHGPLAAFAPGSDNERVASLSL